MTDTITRRRSFAQVPDALVIDKRLTHLAVRLWVRLDKYAGKDGNAFPSRARLADDLGVSKGSIAAALSNLSKAGWITRKPRPDAPGSSWTTELNDESTVPDSAADPDQNAGRGRLAGSSGATNMLDTEGDPLKDTKEGQGSSDRGSSTDDHGLTQSARRKPRTGKPMTQDEMNADFAALKALCLEEGIDDPVSVWWTLKHEHHAVEPSKVMQRLVENGQWDGFVGRHGIGEYKPNGEAA